MIRADLMALSRAALVALANAGFVKRAERELEHGPAPAISDTSDATTVAFADASVVLARGKSLAQCPCTCGATPMCRHRVAAVLAYQRAMVAGADTAPDPSDPSDPSDPANTSDTADSAAPVPPVAWSPGETGDDTLERLLGSSAFARAKAHSRRGLVAEVLRGGNGPDDLPRVHLPTSTVRFLVPRDVGYARCDCTLRTACEHVALAVWAFREADASTGASRRGEALAFVELGGAGHGDARVRALDTALEVATTVLMEGVANLGGGVATRFALARHALERAGLAWPLAAVEELEDLLAAYARRSARYDAGRAAAIVTELFARARAGSPRQDDALARSSGEVPVRSVLGADEALETRLDQTRLVGLGVRLEDDGDARIAHVYLADLGGANVLVLTRRFSGSDDGPLLARRTALSGSSLGAVASGQIVSNAVIRRANRAVSFSTGVLAKTSVMPGADLAALAGDLFVTDVAALQARLRASPPRMLLPRLAASDIVAVGVRDVARVGYDDAQQKLVAVAHDAAGVAFTIELAQRIVAPGAVAALALALGVGLRAVVGRVHTNAHGLVVTPLAVYRDDAPSGRDQSVALELEPLSDAGARALAALPHVNLRPFDSAVGSPPGLLPEALSEALTKASRIVDEAVHHGLRRAPAGFRGDLEAITTRLAALGLDRAAAALAKLQRAHESAKVTGAEPDERAAADAWASATIRLTLLRDRA